MDSACAAFGVATRGRMLRLVHLARRSGALQSSLRARMRAAGLDREKGLHQRRFLGEEVRRRIDVSADRAQPAGCDQRRHRARQGRYQRHEWRGLQPRAEGREIQDRIRLRRQRQAAQPLRCGRALPRRRLRPVQIPSLPGRAAGVRAGRTGRVLRRRSGQFQLPALRPRHEPAARLRGRQAGKNRRLFSIQRQRCPSWRVGHDTRESRQHPAPAHHRAA